MDVAHVITLLLTGGVGLWVLERIAAAVHDGLRARGRIRSEKDALLIARSQWIERYTQVRNAATRGAPVPELESADEYDKWLGNRRKTTT